MKLHLAFCQNYWPGNKL